MEKDIVSQMRAFNRFYTSIIGVTNAHILESEYSLTEVRVMYEIYHNAGINARQLQTIIKVDEGYLSRLIGKLVRDKIISKIRSDEDNRLFSLTLSKKGEEVFLPLQRRSSDAVATLVHHLNSSQQLELMQLLERLTQLLTKK